MRKHLAYGLFLFLLSACATVPKPEAQAVMPDLSRPSLASIYHFVCGSFAAHSDVYLAREHFLKALAYDEQSPQIKRELFKIHIAAFSKNQDDRAGIQKVLAQARQEQVLDVNDLASALQIYAYLDDQEGVDWVLGELATLHRDANGLFLLYSYQYLKDGVVDKKLLKELLNKSENKDNTAFALASLHLATNPELSADLLRQYPNHPNAEQLILEILIKKQDYLEIGRRFGAYQYPQDAQAMRDSINRMRELKQADTILQHSAKIMASSDKMLIAMLAELAYYSENTALIQKISHFLIQETPEPQSDTWVATTLIAYALQYENSTLAMSELSSRVASVRSAQSIFSRYIFSQYNAFETDELSSKAEFDRRVQKLIPDPLLRDYLISLSYKREENPDLGPHYAFVKRLVEKNWAETEDYEFVLYHQQDPAQLPQRIQTLQRAVEQYPNSSRFLNDLGYTLLSLPEHWEEAEMLIKRALENDPEDLAILDSMAWLLYLKKDIPAASSYIPRLLKDRQLQDLQPEILYHMGMIHLAESDLKSAQTCLEAIPDRADAYWQKLNAAIQNQALQH